VLARARGGQQALQLAHLPCLEFRVGVESLKFGVQSLEKRVQNLEFEF